MLAKATNLKRKLAIEFEMKDLRKLRYFLGIEFPYLKTSLSTKECSWSC